MTHLRVSLTAACLDLLVCFVQAHLQCLMILQHGLHVSSMIVLDVFNLPLMFSLAVYAMLAQFVHLHTRSASMRITQSYVCGEVM
jgi:hypothetical protein